MNVGKWQVFKEIQYLQEDVKLALAVGCIDESLRRGAGVMVMKNDQVYSTGVNVDGCLGVPGISSTKLSARIDILCDKQVEELAAGYAHVVALIKSGQVYTWGQNEFSQLGLGDISQLQRAYYSPHIVTGLSGHVVTKIACGFNHTLALTSEGIVFGWGYNKGIRPSEAGPRDTYDYLVDRPTEIKFSRKSTFVLFRKSTNVKIEAISCGRHFSVALTDMGKVYCWGSNSHGQLGLTLETPYCSVPRVVETEHSFKQIACGAYHVVGLTTSGQCYTWGQKGNTAVRTPTLIGENLSAITEIGAIYLAHTSALVASGKVYVWGQLKEKLDPTVKLDHFNLNEFLPTPYLTECSSIDEAFNQWPSPAVMLRCFRQEMLPVQTGHFRNGNNSQRLSTELGARGGHENTFDGIKVIPHWKVPLTNTAGEPESLGEGNSSVVYKAVYKNKQVAVKRMHSSGPEYMKTVMRELKALASIGSHENIVQLVGVIEPPASFLPEPENMLIVTEYCELGDLKNFLLERRPFFQDENRNGQFVLKRPLTTDPKPSTSKYVKYDVTDWTITTTDLVRWSIQFAKGMEYLASKNIVHGDLALRNLLLTASKVVKVSDFGLSRPIQGSDYYRFDPKESFPWTCAAPETFDDRKISIASDVWGFGITLWEIFTLGEVPFNNLFPNFSEEFKSAVREGLRLKRPEFATEPIYNVMASCWQLKPDSRPKFKKILEMLLTLNQPVQIGLDSKSPPLNAVNAKALAVNISHADDPIETNSKLLAIALGGQENAFDGINVIPHWQIPLENTAGTTEILAVGYNSSVLRAIYKNKHVAVKRMKTCRQNGMQKVVRELTALASIGTHENIVELVGVIEPPESFLGLKNLLVVTEYCRLGDLQSFLLARKHFFQNQIKDGQIVVESHIKTDSITPTSLYVTATNTDVYITTVDLVRWSIQLAKGMAYLASKNIVHWELALRNLLLTGDKVVKVSGFELPIPIPGCDDYTLCPYPSIPWASVAPEALDDGKIHTASDVWAFGITLWEIFTLGERPYRDRLQEFSQNFVPALREGYRLGRPEFATEQIYNVMASCWQLDPNSRPTFEELLQALSTIGYSRVKLIGASLSSLQ